ncbi:hypothetical protein PS1_008365 [Malus domestica]
MVFSFKMGFATFCSIAICVSILSGSTAVVGAAALVEEASAKVCIRNVDCDFLIKCNPGGLKLCRDGKCVCIPKSAVAVEEGEPQCRHYRDCEYRIDCKPGKLKACFVGECVCVTDNRGSPPTHR